MPFASLLVSGGASLEMIGKLLGHTQIGTTQRYAHLIESPLRAGVNAVGEMLRLLRSVGTHRGDRPLSPMEVAHLLRKATAAGSTRKQCAEGLGLGQSQIATFLKLPELAREVQHLADWGGSTSASISFSSLAELARLRHPEQAEAANAILRYGLTWKEVVQLVQIADRGAKPVAQCLQEVLRLRPQIETRHLFVGAITSESLKRHIQGLSQRERDKLIEGALAALLDHKGTIRGRLSPNSFTILSSQDVPKLLGLKPDDLERAINDAAEQTRTTA